MDNRQSIQRLFIFDLWCTRKLTDFIRDSSEFREQASTTAFLSHIINAQRIWFNRVIDIKTADTDPWHEYPIDDIKQEAKSVHKLWIDLIGDHDMDMDARIVYQNSAGMNFVNSFSEICQHLILHGQHHRAQISLLLSRSGIKPPPIDYIHYLRT